MTEHNGQSHSDPDSGSDDNKLAPEGHKLQKTKTALRFASSKLSLVNNPVQESHEDDEEESLIHHDHKKPETPGQPTEQSPLRFTKVFMGLRVEARRRIADEGWGTVDVAGSGVDI